MRLGCLLGETSVCGVSLCVCTCHGIASLRGMTADSQPETVWVSGIWQQQSGGGRAGGVVLPSPPPPFFYPES